jgi:hypothetical protein
VKQKKKYKNFPHPLCHELLRKEEKNFMKKGKIQKRKINKKREERAKQF